MVENSQTPRPSFAPTWSDTADLPAQTRIESWRGVRAPRSDLIDPTIAVHHGRVVKRTGDGSIVEFRSVVDAVRCAICGPALTCRANGRTPLWRGPWETSLPLSNRRLGVAKRAFRRACPEQTEEKRPRPSGGRAPLTAAMVGLFNVTARTVGAPTIL